MKTFSWQRKPAMAIEAVAVVVYGPPPPYQYFLVYLVYTSVGLKLDDDRSVSKPLAA